jgi:N-acetyl-anhydromuramyl-L-alanine amidase AmpD
MHFNSLSTLEENLQKTGNKGEYELKMFSIPVKNESLTLKGFFAKPKNRSKYFFDVEHPKKRIVLHFTAGQLRSDLQALTGNERHVSTPFVIGRNGIIYQLFSSKFWSGHIGKGIGNTNTGNAQDKITIGIELSNYGYLTEKSGNLETYYSRQKDDKGNIGPVDVYCSLADTQAYSKISTPFRSQIFYSTFTDAQYDSLIVLLRYLTVQYNIPREFLSEPQRYQAGNHVLQFNGIVSHVNYRESGKWDIGPAFDWEKVIKGVQASTYTPVFAGFEIDSSEDSMFENVGGEVNSEDQLQDFLPEAVDASLEDEPYEETQPIAVPD